MKKFLLSSKSMFLLTFDQKKEKREILHITFFSAALFVDFVGLIPLICNYWCDFLDFPRMDMVHVRFAFRFQCKHNCAKNLTLQFSPKKIAWKMCKSNNLQLNHKQLFIHIKINNSRILSKFTNFAQFTCGIYRFDMVLMVFV